MLAGNHTRNNPSPRAITYCYVTFGWQRPNELFETQPRLTQRLFAGGKLDINIGTIVNIDINISANININIVLQGVVFPKDLVCNLEVQ